MRTKENGCCRSEDEKQILHNVYIKKNIFKNVKNIKEKVKKTEEHKIEM